MLLKGHVIAPLLYGVGRGCPVIMQQIDLVAPPAPSSALSDALLYQPS